MSKGSDKEKSSSKRKDSRERNKSEKRKKSDRNSESRENRDDDSKRRRHGDDNADFPPKRYWNKDAVDDVENIPNKGENYKVGSRYYEASNKGSDSKRSKNYEVGTRYYDVENKDKADKPVERKPKKDDLLTTKTGGAYIPPAKLKMMRAEITDKSSMAYQRLSWEALKKSIHGYINKINTGNIATIIKELLRENIVRGRGLLCRSIIQAQAASPTFTHVYAALASAINSRFPNIGELLLKRLVVQFKRGFKRNDKAICISGATFIAHLVNQKVSHEILALEILTLLVESPTDDSVEVAIAFLKECGQKLTEVSAKGVNAIFEMLRNILHEGQLDKRVQYMIEVMFQIRKDGFKDHVAVVEELELVPEDDQFTHLIMLDEVTDPQDLLNVFKFDADYEGNEGKYKELSKEILGSDAESNSDEESESGDESGSETEEENQENAHKDTVIIDNTETNLIALRRTIYLTIHSSLDFEECAHKLMKMQLKPGQEMELCHMFLDCCAEQRTYEKFYGLLAQRFCQISKIYVTPFEQIFKDSYGTAHRLDTNRLRNVSKFFAHLLFTDAISWEALDCVKLNEEDTTSSSRIFVKILFQELAEYMGLGKLNERLKDPTLQDAFTGIFPRDNPKNTRFAINFFTSIGLGGLTDELREHLKQAPKPETINLTNESKDDGSSSSSSSSDSSSDSSSSSSSDSSDSDSSDSSESEDTKKKKKDAKKKKPVQDDEIEKSPDRPPFKNNRNRENDYASKSNNYNERNQNRFRQPDKRPNRDYDNQSRYSEKQNDQERRDRNDPERTSDKKKIDEQERRNDKEKRGDRERRNDRERRVDQDIREKTSDRKDDQERRNDKERRGERERMGGDQERRNDRDRKVDQERNDDRERMSDKKKTDDQERRNEKDKRGDRERRTDREYKDHSNKRRH